MAKIVITLQDTEEGDCEIKADFDPPLYDNRPDDDELTAAETAFAIMAQAIEECK